jgi:hypothetical protein
MHDINNQHQHQQWYQKATQGHQISNIQSRKKKVE